MLARSYKFWLNHTSFLKINNRSIYKLNKIVSCTKEINKFVHNSVPLTTSSAVNQFKQFNWSYSSRNYCTIDSPTFEKVCEETLDSLYEYFDELIETTPHLDSADVTYSSGVLTVNFGNPYGTYVINRQSPNHQIWLSSPTTGPKRYDFVPDKKYWIYKHDNVSLHQLLQKEVQDIVKKNIDFSRCSYSLL